MALTRRQIIQLSDLIVARRDELADELREDTTDPSDAAGLADSERDFAELRELDDAAARLAVGTYDGNCGDCGAEIGFERLLARPGAIRCIACQRLHEANPRIEG